MHPIVLRSLALAMVTLAIGLAAFAGWYGLRGGNPLGVLVTAAAVLAGGFALRHAATKQAR